MLLGKGEADVLLAVGTLAAFFALVWLRFTVREKLMLQAARMRATVKIGSHYFYVVDADEYMEMVAQDRTNPNRLQDYQVDAALAWLKRMDAGFYSRNDGEQNHISSADLVRTVLKAVREAQP
jgi:hypothetical protein